MIGFPTLASVSELLEENQIGKSSQSTLITATEQPIPMIPLLYGIGVVFFFLLLFNHSMPAILIRSSKSTQTIHGLYMIKFRKAYLLSPSLIICLSTPTL